MVTTIQLDERVKRKLDKLKVHPRESYNELLDRMTDNYDVDKEGLTETIEIMSDPETMRRLAKSIEDVKKGRLIPFEEV